MRLRFLLGPAGSGKSFRCMTEIRQALADSPDGPPLLLVAPKQTTYQLERQFLAEPSLPGYTRLHILSFERLANFIFERLGKHAPAMLDEEGRLMVLRGLLARKRSNLKLFRASARLTGFAQELSQVLAEFQRNQFTPKSLNDLADQVSDVEGLALKLQDLATLLCDYLNWLHEHNLQDSGSLLPNAAQTLEPQETQRDGDLTPKATDQLDLFSISDSAIPTRDSTLQIEGLWVDGFADLAPDELNLLAGLLPHCAQATITFCLDQAPSPKPTWLSNWSLVQKSLEECKRRFEKIPGVTVSSEILPRERDKSRFTNNPILEHLEKFWAEPGPFEGPIPALASTLRVVACASPEAEVKMAAREILRYVHKGGRYRDVTVLVRKLPNYHVPLQRLFSRYSIPFFLDRRESVSHHPLAELTRSALRTVATDWNTEDWFAALKTGLVPADDEDIDKLENEALAHGWKGSVWQKPLVVESDPELTAWLGKLRKRILPPFQHLALTITNHQNRPTGPQLSSAVREFWKLLNVEQQLEEWATAEISPSDFQVPSSVHGTVWDQMNAWLDNVDLAFPSEHLTLREWLPILEAGLSNLSVGVIPPALDQVLIGALDRSRNPDIKLAILLGMNEGIFPASPEATVLLSDTDRVELERRNFAVGGTVRYQLSRERYYAYIACTRARERLVLACALNDSNGSPLNPSPFLSQLKKLFPALVTEASSSTLDWRDSEHPSEMVPTLLCVQNLKNKLQEHGLANGETRSQLARWTELEKSPAFSSLITNLRHFHNPTNEQRIAPELAAKLYGPVLRTSVSRLEQFAACPFRFFVNSGLRAEERREFELDIREQGNFQHEVLFRFHQELHDENKRWRDITSAEARKRIESIAKTLVLGYREGLFQATEQSKFMARILTESLQDFVETLVEWMRGQYEFDPVAVELGFGREGELPAWQLDLGNGSRLALRGRIDRVDLFRDPERKEALCVVLDYKSSQKQLDPVLMENGLQLQLLAYLNVLRQWPKAREYFGVEGLSPVGVFYVNLRGKYDRKQNRTAALADIAAARKLAYRHAGRFDTSALQFLDGRTNVTEGDQFNFRLTKSGAVHKSCREAMDTVQFTALLDSVAENLKKMGREIFAGSVEVSPYRKGIVTACDQCSYQSICRIDPWTHSFRVLRKVEREE